MSNNKEPKVTIDSFYKSWTDAKKEHPTGSYYQYPAGYFLSRYSSPMRIGVSTTNAAVFSFFYSMAWVIRKEVPRLPVIVRTVSGATLLGLTHSTLNEMFNGLVARRYGKEQFWISNSLAGFSTFSLYYIFENIVRGKPFGESFTKSKKYVGFLTLGFMLQEVVMIKLRDHYLQRQPVKLEWGFDVYELKVDPLLPPEIGTTRVRHHHSLQQRRQTEVSDV